jgi:predicted nucleic acid-binding protein
MSTDTPLIVVADSSGESEAILLYKEIQATYLIIDDKHAREIAEELGITCIGTLGILYRAKEKGLIQELRPLFLQLLTHDRYYAQPLLNHLLKKANEALIL